MPTKRRSRKKAKLVSDLQLLKDSEKALKKAKRVLELELKEVKSYIKALAAHNPFPL
jgi:hypothetical protein